MDITLDITNLFNTVVDCSGELAYPTIFLNLTSKKNKTFEFELMNFNLNLEDAIDDQLRPYGGKAESIADCTFPIKMLFIFGKASIRIEEFKGLDLELSASSEVWEKENLYYSSEYKVLKNDMAFVCGGNLSTLPYWANIYIIASKKAKATLSFSLEESILIDQQGFDYEHLKTINPYKYESNIKKGIVFDSIFGDMHFTNEKGKMFASDFRSKYFTMDIFNEVNKNYLAIRDEA